MSMFQEAIYTVNSLKVNICSYETVIIGGVIFLDIGKVYLFLGVVIKWKQRLLINGYVL